MNKTIDSILFDLDGTLLPLDEKLFEKYYFGSLIKTLDQKLKLGENLVKIIWAGTKELIKNDGSKSNEDVFWAKFEQLTNIKKNDFEQDFTNFYLNEFIKAKEACFPSELSNKIVKLAISKGYKVTLATNPLFPLVATKQRIMWAGLDINDFELVTAYENSTAAKPSLTYYEEVLRKIGKTPSQCIMVGNDATEDMVVHQMGMETYLVTDCLLNEHNVDISKYKNGSLQNLLDYVDSLPNIK